MDVSDAPGQVKQQARKAGRRGEHSETLDKAIRVGLVSYGVVHLILAWLALRIAFGDSGGSASSSGAFQQIAKTTAGQLTLYVVAFGFLALIVWQGFEAAQGHRRHDGAKRAVHRATSAGRCVLYGILGFTALTTATGSGSGGSGTDGWTSKLMGLPFGPVLVGAVGVGVLVVAGVLAYRGWAEKFRSKLGSDGQTGKDGSAYVVFGKVGYLGKAIAIAAIGVLFLYSAVTHDADKSAGMDQALHQLVQQPFGAPVLVLVALGFASFGLFCFAWARHLDR